MNILGSGKNRRVVRRAPSIYYSPGSNQQNTPSKINWRLFWLLFKLLLPIALIVYGLYFSPLFRLKDVIISGNSYITRDKILESIPKNTNVLNLDTKKLEAKIERELTDIDQVKIYRGIPDAIKIVVAEHNGALVWQSGISYYLVSSRGVAFRDISNEIANYGQLPRIVDKRNLPVTVSRQIVSNNFVDFTTQIYKNIKTEANLDPDYFSVDETTVDVYLYTKNNLYVKFDSFRSADKQMNDLKLVLLDKKPEIKEYIDLRVNGWAYYK